MRIAHATDIHWMVPPRGRDLGVKRTLGTANLYLRGRRHHFSRAAQQALVAQLQSVDADLVMITGDLTAQALDAEFEMAHADLTPVLEDLPTFLVPGNHDVYTAQAHRDRVMAKWFGPWMGLRPDGLGRIDHQYVTLIGLDPNRPSWFGSTGEVPTGQLDALAQVLADPQLADRAVGIAIHYPVVDRRGNLYDKAPHGLVNAAALRDVLDRAPHRPAWIACGHVHHGYTADLRLSDGSVVPIVNCGSSGQAYRPDLRRTAAMAVYEMSARGDFSTERYLYDGEGFVIEADGPWTTTR